MTIIAGFSSSRHGTAPLHLAAQLSATTGERVVAAAIVECALPAGVDPIEDEYQSHVAAEAKSSLQQVVNQLGRDTSVLVHRATSIPRGLSELVHQHGAGLVVLGSSSSGLLGRITLGSVTEQLVHTAAVPVALAPRGYPLNPLSIQRLTVAYGGAADTVGLVAAAADLARRWSIGLRIASFTVRPSAMFSGSIEPSAENLVLRRWELKTAETVRRQLDAARTAIAIPDVDLVIGASTEWRDAVEGIPWQRGDLLLLGSGAAGPRARVFLGSAASKILRHAPVPTMILPKLKSSQNLIVF